MTALDAWFGGWAGLALVVALGSYWDRVVGFLVELAATLLGVWAAFALEERRRRGEERQAYQNLLRGVVEEVAALEAKIEGVARNPMAYAGDTFETPAIRAALANPARYAHAPVTLTLAMQMVLEALPKLRSELIAHSERVGRFAADPDPQQAQRAMSVFERDVRVWIETCRQYVVNLLKPELEAQLPMPGQLPGKDPRVEQFYQRLRDIHRDQSQRPENSADTPRGG